MDRLNVLTQNMKSFVNRSLQLKLKHETITIVSGLPRSGTSMMMQVLQAGGVPVVTDAVRKADQNNPRGYYEFESVKRIEKDTSWIQDCQGKAIKMISVLLYHLPNNNRYKIIFMQRGMGEILKSQKAMLMRLGERGSSDDDMQMTTKYEQHLLHVKDWLAKQSNIDVIYVDYYNVIQEPFENAKAICKFLGYQLNIKQMAGVVEESLYRQKEDTVR